MQFSIADAKNKLPELIRAVEAGEPVTICRRGIPVADLVPAAATDSRPRFGTQRSRIAVKDVDWWKPMSDADAEAFIGAGD